MSSLDVPPPPQNEPVNNYAPGTPHRAALKAELSKMRGEIADIPMFIGGREERTNDLLEVKSPHEKSLILGRAHQGTSAHAERAIKAALTARPTWAAMSQSERSAVFLRAAELAATTWRAKLNAATMLGQSKTAYQAEIDSACELIDFWRFNVAFASRLLEPLVQVPNTWNRMEARPLEGFVCAITPFNFTAIAGNLPTAPALLGNTVVWKPSPLALRSAHEVMSILRAAGLPDGVINLVNGPAEEIVGACIDHDKLAGVHFTGSTSVFRSIWKRVGENIGKYAGYPRLVGETGGKDFVFAHASADLDSLAVALARGAFEYQGQKCSAASRAYIPRSIWQELRDRLVATVEGIKVGDVSDFRNLMGAVIDERAFAKHKGVIEEAKAAPHYAVVAGGKTDDQTGFFVHPTIVESESPRSRLMTEEFFGPILTIWVYEDSRLDEALTECDEGSSYALTGAVFGRDRTFVERATVRLRDAAGNFYVNDKPTGAVVGQQPFGGARGSGTNDKAGSALNLYRWLSPRTIKETFVPPTEMGYPSMSEP
ncbi:MAG: L-glutamate gamma-semialdehyde dehydrogenase [Polyangiaceae bacterium]|nr:L-glutamate gamma-semialdehyde dehydrogenase [Polyangiaceae bacterium]